MISLNKPATDSAKIALVGLSKYKVSTVLFFYSELNFFAFGKVLNNHLLL